MQWRNSRIYAADVPDRMMTVDGPRVLGPAISSRWGCKRRAVPGKRSVQGSKVDRKKLTPAASRAQSLRGAAIGGPWCVLPASQSWELGPRLLLAAPAAAIVDMVQLLAARCNVERRHPRGESPAVCVGGEAARPFTEFQFHNLPHRPSSKPDPILVAAIILSILRQSSGPDNGPLFTVSGSAGLPGDPSACGTTGDDLAST